MDRIEKLVRVQDWYRIPAAEDWRDGMLIGNGLLGIPSFALDAMEFIVNANDVYDKVTNNPVFTPHREVMEKMAASPETTARFLDDTEKLLPSFTHNESQRRSISAARLRVRFGYSVGWNAPATPVFKQHLSLYDGILHTSGDSHLFHVASESFVPHGRRVMVFRMQNLQPEFQTGSDAMFERPAVVELFRPDSTNLAAPAWRNIDENTMIFKQDFEAYQDGTPSGCYVVALRVIPDGNCVIQETGSVGNAGRVTMKSPEFTLMLSVASSFSVSDPECAALQELDAATSAGFEALKDENCRFWAEFWHRSNACFGDEKELQKYYTFSLYEIGSTFGGVPMTGLNGFAYGPLNSLDYGVGSPGYTHDQNAQIPCMPCLMLNHLEYFDQLADTYLQVLDRIKAHTRELFDCPGAFLPLAMTQAGDECPTRSYRYTLCGGAYTGWLLAMRWKFRQDEEFFHKRMLPLLKEFAEFYLAYMKVVPTGSGFVYELDWSIPPEIFRMTRNDNATLALLKTMLTILCEACETYGVEKEFAFRCQEVLAHYPEFCQRPDGAWWCGPDIPLDHYMWGGHLMYPFFPSEADTGLDEAKATIKYIENFAVERSFADPEVDWHPNHDWAWLLLNAARQRCGMREESWEELGRFIRYFGKENGLFSHNPVIIADPAVTENKVRDLEAGEYRNCDDTTVRWVFNDGQSVTANPRAKQLSPAVVEGNSIFAFTASEALLQSWGGVIRFFPGVKPGFSGWFEKFLVPPGVEVSAEMRDGKLVSYSFESDHDCTLNVQFSPDSDIKEVFVKGI